MGQKVHPFGFRLGYIRTWNSRWYAGKDYAVFLHEDLRIRARVKEKLYHAAVARIEIERSTDNQVRVSIYSARPGIIIGRRGGEVDKLKAELELLSGRKIQINIREVRYPEMQPQLVAESVATQLERRVSFRRAMKKAVSAATHLKKSEGVQGIKINVSGRLGGREIARSSWYREGKVPLHKLRADVDYGFAQAKTTHGLIGVKVWIYKGDVVNPSGVESTERS